ncbi:hypothetical protein O6H91_08G003700 [Diphasiastrum complanatum]|uniref:Uncharacterized protein n=2 Tax=Diphasiastrum complanatum TaxID=34168 RepID=A0ACC2CV99_DIPCM|nr:hypothetical protein O6H91_08G003500 [Diphasiastrum complanatum]KAJ7545612.1 hypothetical protein O6H91_08G003700 [Diphasiastrum complanatum]
MGFFFLAVGSAGIRPCIAPFGAEQFDEQDPKQKKQLESFFSWYYFSLVVSVLITVTALVYVQDNVGSNWGFGVPAVCMLVSLVVFSMGASLYRRKPPMGSPFAQLAHVMVAAIRKRNLELPSDSNMLYELRDKELGIAGGTKLLHTQHFRFLDKAAIITESDSPEETPKVGRWLLCTVHEVEQLKSVLQMLPLFSSGILFFASNAQHGTFWVQQARTLDRNIGHGFLIPPGSMGFFNNITMVLYMDSNLRQNTSTFCQAHHWPGYQFPATHWNWLILFHHRNGCSSLLRDETSSRCTQCWAPRSPTQHHTHLSIHSHSSIHPRRVGRGICEHWILRILLRSDSGEYAQHGYRHLLDDECCRQLFFLLSRLLREQGYSSPWRLGCRQPQ